MKPRAGIKHRRGFGGIRLLKMLRELLLPVLLMLVSTNVFPDITPIVFHFKKDKHWFIVTGVKIIHLNYDSSTGLFELDHDRSETQSYVDIPPLFLLGGSYGVVSLFKLTSSGGKLELTKVDKWISNERYPGTFHNFIYKAPDGRLINALFAKDVTGKHVLLEKLKSMKGPNRESLSSYILSAFSKAEDKLSFFNEKNVNWIQYEGLSPVWGVEWKSSLPKKHKQDDAKIITTNTHHLETAGLDFKKEPDAHNKQQTDRLHLDTLEASLAEIEAGYEHNRQKVRMHSLSYANNPSAAGYAGTVGFVGSLGLYSGNTVGTPLASISPPRVQNIPMPELPAGYPNSEKLSPLVEKIRAANEDTRSEARRAPYWKRTYASRILNRIDLSTYQLERGVVGVLKVMNSGSETLVYEGIYHAKNQWELVAVKQMCKDSTHEIEMKRNRLLDYYENQAVNPHLMPVKDWLKTPDYILSVETYGAPIVVNNGNQWSEEELATFAYQILSAVAALHARQYVHRDVKPENVIWLSREGKSHYILTDFGALRKIDSHNMLFSMVGTLGYLDARRTNACLMGAQNSPLEDCNGNGYEQDLLAYAISLITLYTGRHPKLISKESRPTAHPLQSFADAVETLEAAATDDKSGFSEVFVQYLDNLDYPARSLPGWFVQLIGETLGILSKAKESTASDLLQKFFPNGAGSVLTSHTPSTDLRSENNPPIHIFEKTGTPDNPKVSFHSDARVFVNCPECGKSFDFSQYREVDQYDMHTATCKKVSYDKIALPRKPVKHGTTRRFVQGEMEYEMIYAGGRLCKVRKN